MDCYDQEELIQLHDLAVDHCDGYAATKCHYVYRNKSPEYFQDILNRRRPIMTTYLKDNSGDQRSPLNGAVKGLFFSATVQWGRTDGTPLVRSAFGTKRLLLEPHALTEHTNLYFADFYCMRTPEYHYVTLVLANKVSYDDEWCRRNLLKLSYADKRSNPFFYVKNGRHMVSQRSNLLVELFYMDNVDLSRVRHLWQDVRTFGKGSSTPGGIPKNPYCSICNFNYPDNQRIWDALWYQDGAQYGSHMGFHMGLKIPINNLYGANYTRPICNPIWYPY